MAEQEPPSELLKRQLRELVPAAGGSVSGALIGLAVGGPAGAVAGAVAEPAVEQLVKEALALRRRRAERVYELAAVEAGISPEELLQRILGDERLLGLAAAVVAAASETALDAKIRALGRALATGALAADEAVVAEQRLLVNILADLEAPHVRLLAQLAKPNVREAFMGRADPHSFERYGWTFEELRRALPTLGDGHALEPMCQPHGQLGRGDP
jgi:hypothetical protein